MTSRTLLVIPHYRDTARLEPFLADLKTLPERFEVLVSDDGSGADEVTKLRALIARSRERGTERGAKILDPLEHTPNTGKGGAVLRGWSAAGPEHDLLAFVDADGAVSATELLRAETYMRAAGDGLSALFGSRVKMLGRSIQRTPKRHLSGRVFATLVSIVSKVPAYDTQCGLKILRRPAFDLVRPHMTTPGFAFDVELCMLLRRFGCRIEEFPVDWMDVAGSKVSLFRDSVRMAREVFRIQRQVSSIEIPKRN